MPFCAVKRMARTMETYLKAPSINKIVETSEVVGQLRAVITVYCSSKFFKAFWQLKDDWALDFVSSKLLPTHTVYNKAGATKPIVKSSAYKYVKKTQSDLRPSDMLIILLFCTKLTLMHGFSIPITRSPFLNPAHPQTPTKPSSINSPLSPSYEQITLRCHTAASTSPSPTLIA